MLAKSFGDIAWGDWPPRSPMGCTRWHSISRQGGRRGSSARRRDSRVRGRPRPPSDGPQATSYPGLQLVGQHQDPFCSRSYSFGPSARPGTYLWPLLTPGRASRRLSTPAASQHALRPLRVLRTHCHAYACRIMAVPFRARTGLRRIVPPHPDTSPHIRFLFVWPALCSGFSQTRGRTQKTKSGRKAAFCVIAGKLLYLPWTTMYRTAASTSASDRPGLPPFAGM